MGHMRGIVLVIFSLISVLIWRQEEVQFQNKALRKVLLKDGISDFSQISELNIADSIKQQYSLQGKFFEINSDISQNKYIYIGRVNNNRAGGRSIYGKIPNAGDSEYFDYFILFDIDKKVQLVKVFNYQATHGHEVTAKGWLKQFIGHDGSEPLQVGKNIDAISGATISVHSITLDLEMKTEILHKLKM